MDPRIVDHLYGLPAGEFVSNRNALVQDLRASGDKATAAEVAKLRRPTGTAWALNQIARDQEELLDAALAAKGALRSVTEGTNRGEDLDLRTATAADRAATRAVVGAARVLLGTEDPGLASRIAGTLLAAVLDDEVASVVRAGRLAAELDASAFSLAGGDLAEVIVLADRAPRRAARPDEATKADAKVAAEAERARKRRRVERERVVERLMSRVARLEQAEAEAEAAARSAREELARATAELADARAALDDD